MCSQKPAVAGCFYKSWEVEFSASIEVKGHLITWLDLITSFREPDSSSSFAEGLQVQTEHENSLNICSERYTCPQITGGVAPKCNYYNPFHSRFC